MAAVSFRKRFEWPPHVRQMMYEDLCHGYLDARAAKEAFKIRVYIGVEQGVTTRQIADKLGISQASVSKYRIEGEALYQARQAAAE
jgi:hypothetical protein